MATRTKRKVKGLGKKKTPTKKAPTKRKKKALVKKMPEPVVVDAELIEAPMPVGHELQRLPTGGAIMRQKKGVMLAHWNGRFGNRMHQYAFGATYSKKFKIPFLLPSEWEGLRLFKDQKHEVIMDDELRLWLNQTSKEMDTLDSRSEAVKRHNEESGSEYKYLNPDNPSETYSGKEAVFFDSVCAYHPYIFKKQSTKYLKEEVFAWNEHVKNLDCYKEFEDKQGTYDIAHLRRDDVSNGAYNRSNIQGYSVVGKASYEKAFKEFDFDPEKIEWTSDDRTGRWHKDRVPEEKMGGWRYPEGCDYLGPHIIFDWLPDFLRLYFARTIFRANSSFSWWAGFLSPTVQVYSPVLDKQHIYGKDNDGEEKEIEVKFVKGNHPHWMYDRKDIRLGK